jgi:conjugal transfer ATP-binding protein TraC
MISALKHKLIDLKHAFLDDQIPEIPRPIANEAYFSTKQEYNRFSDVLPWTGYESDSQLFVLEGEEPDSIDAVGYTIELQLQTGATNDMAVLLRELFLDATVGCGIQVQLFGSPDIRDWLATYANLVRLDLLPDDNQRSIIEKITRSRIVHYRRASITPLISSRPSVMRNFRAILCVTFPATRLSPQVIKKCTDLRAAQVSKLKT